jgi:hypothetical protein
MALIYLQSFFFQKGEQRETSGKTTIDRAAIIAASI